MLLNYMACFICLEVIFGISVHSDLSTSLNYCKLGWDHTLCNYPMGSGCPKIASGVNSTTIEDILWAHNKYRQKVALGQEIGQPMASNMKEMVWDEELATVAQRWADQCTFGHDMNRKTFGFLDWVGQNVAFSSEWSALNSTPDFSGTAINMWFKEVSGFNPKYIDPFHYSSNAAHYTQIVWAETFALGCGYTFYTKDDFYLKHYICNYGPGGNFVGDTMYQQGEACSGCQEASCSAKFPGLCQSSSSNSTPVIFLK